MSVLARETKTRRIKRLARNAAYHGKRRVRPLVASPDRAKPRQPTILKRTTALSLYYLVERGLAPEFDRSDLIVAKSSRKKLGRKFITDSSPTHGV